MNPEIITNLSKKINNVKVAIYGDFCLDAYWILKPGGSEVSVETGLLAEAVEKQYYSLGGASNIVANLAALKPNRIKVIGVIGDDIFGREIKRQFDGLGIDNRFLVTQKENFSTVTFCKRILDGKEKARIDIGFFNRKSIQTDNILIQGIEDALGSCDVLIFNQQVPGSITNNEFVKRVNRLFIKNNDKKIILDSRHYGKYIKNTFIKTNINEAVKINKYKEKKDIRTISEDLYQLYKKPVFITQGSRGISVFDSEGYSCIPGIKVNNNIDTVGAGDTVTSAIALGIAVGEDNKIIIKFANLAAAVAIQKLFKTGTASIDEIIRINKK